MTMTAPIAPPHAAALARAHQTTKTRCRVFHLGLDAREVLVIEGVFRANPELAERYVFGAPPADDDVDLLFVNGDDDHALRAWHEIKATRPEVLCLLVTAQPERHAGARTLAKPLNFRNFSSILDAITSSDTPFLRTAANSAGGELRVLVVDDSFPARQFMKFKIEELAAASSIGVQVDLADSGEKAVGIAQACPYDLVFLDVVMPGLDGYETCRQLKALRALRVAMLTGRTTQVDFAQGRAAGCDNYLTKPPNDIDLRTVLRLTSLKKLTASR